MFPFKWTPLVLNIFDKNVKSQLEGRKGIPQSIFCRGCQRSEARAPRPAMPRSAGASRVQGGQAASAAQPPRCLTTMDLLLLCILVLFCVNKVNTPFKLNTPPGDWMPDLGRRLSPGLQKGWVPLAFPTRWLAFMPCPVKVCHSVQCEAFLGLLPPRHAQDIQR